MTKHILIIDDDTDIRKWCKIFLGKYKNIKVLEADDGSKGLELAKQKKPDLILLDNKMPGMTGVEFAKLLRGDPGIHSIPVIMITAMKLSQQEINMTKLEVNGFIQKPFNSEKLKQTIEDYVGKLVEVEEKDNQPHGPDIEKSWDEM